MLACEEGKGPDGSREVLRLISRKVPVARAFEDSRASLRQANQESSSGVVKRDRLSSINIEGRAVDRVVPESGLVALGRTTLVALARGAYVPWLSWLSLFVGAFALHRRLQKGGLVSTE